MKKSTTGMLVPALALIGMLGCESVPHSASDQNAMEVQVAETIRSFKQKDPGISTYFDTAHAYAVFPSVGKGAVGVGGAHGVGEVRHHGQTVGYAELTQGTIGLQLGGQVYSEVIFFENAAAFDRFKADDFAFSAQASAIAAKAGASADADYERGVVVFTMGKGGLMFEASIGGQKFDFEPK